MAKKTARRSIYKPEVRWRDINHVLKLLGLRDLSNSQGEARRVRRMIEDRMAVGHVIQVRTGVYRLA